MAVEDTWLLRDGKTRSKRWGRGLRYRVRWKDAPARSFRTKGEAERHWLKVRTEQPEPEVTDATVAELLERWLATKRGLTKKGYEGCRDAAKVVRAEFGDRAAASLTTEEVQAWVAGLTVRLRRRVDGRMQWVVLPASESQRRKPLQSLAGSLRLVHLDTCDGVKVAHRQGRDAHFLSMTELQQLALAAGAGAPMVLFLGTTGMRIGEACALNVADVDVGRRRARIRRSKGGVARDVPVPQSVLDRLDLDRPVRAPLFVAPKGGRTLVHNWRHRVFNPAAVRADLLPLVPHDLRHTAASLAIAAGADVKVVQRMLGHKSAKMTLDLYGHLFDRSLDDVADRLDLQLRPVVPGTTQDGGAAAAERDS